MLKKGFTLVELLAVIVILAIIAVIAMPSIMKVIQESKVNAWLRQKDMLVKAAKTYMVKEDIIKTRYITIEELRQKGYIKGIIKDYEGNIIEDTYAVAADDYIQSANLIPENSRHFETRSDGWQTYNGSNVTLSQNINVPEWNTTDATRIKTAGGTSGVKYLYSIGAPSFGVFHSISIYIKNIGSSKLFITSNLRGKESSILPNQGKFIYFENIEGNDYGHLQIQFFSEVVNDSLDFIVYQPTIWRVK